MGKSANFSLRTKNDNSVQQIQKAYFIKGLEVVFTERLIATKDSTKNKKSNDFHQTGCVSCSVIDPACAINNKGVTKQCAKHNKLVAIPRASELLRMYEVFKRGYI